MRGLRYKGKWLEKRVLALPDGCSTNDVKAATGACETTVRRWLADGYFLEAGVAQWDDTTGRWKWHPALLRTWLRAIGSLKCIEFIVTENPSSIGVMESIDDARAFFHMPTGYSIKRAERDRTDHNRQ